jgi:hypothetical protein
MKSSLERFLSSIIELAWDVVTTRETVGGVNLKRVLVKQLLSALTGRTEDQSTSTNTPPGKDLKRIVSDMMKLRKVALSLPPEEKRALFFTLLTMLATSLLGSEGVKALVKEAGDDEGQERSR